MKKRRAKRVKYKVTDEMLSNALRNGGSCEGDGIYKYYSYNKKCSCPLSKECNELFQSCNYNWGDDGDREGFEKKKKRMLERYIFRSLNKLLEEGT